MGSFPMKVSFVWPFPRSSKMVTSYAPSIASCSIPNCAGSTLFPFESEKYMVETIFSRGTISWYSTAFQHSCPSGALMQKRDFPPTRKSIWQTGAAKPFRPHHCITYSGSGADCNQDEAWTRDCVQALAAYFPSTLHWKRHG